MRQILGLALLLVVAGCGKTADSIVGQWKMNGIFEEATGQQIMAPDDSILEFKSDGTYQSTMVMKGVTRVKLFSTYDIDGQGALTRSVKKTEILDPKTNKWVTKDRTGPSLTDKATLAGDVLTIRVEFPSTKRKAYMLEKYVRVKKA